MILAETLQKRFGATLAVDALSFSASDQAVTGLVGPNGAGKTTSLRMICGLVKPDGGAVTVDGQDVAAHPQVVQAHLGVLPDQSGLYGRLTPREHIRYFGNLRGLGGVTLEQRIEQWIDTLDLKSVADRRVAGFSHGERTRVALARALVHDPQNVLLDEPTNGLDVLSTRTVRDVIRRLKSAGRCVLFSSHVMQEVSALCDRIVVIASGHVVAQGTADDLLARTKASNLEEAFVSLVDPAAAETNGGAA
jgi:sodium transport system ATP-binding protein